MNNLKRKAITAQALTTGDEGQVSAIVSVFDVRDSYGDIMRQGAFKESIGTKLPAVLWMHRGPDIIGKTLEAKELAPGDKALPESIRDKGGLYVLGQLYLDEAPYAKLAHIALRDAVVDEFSIGYYEQEAADERKDEEWWRNVTKVDLVEWSPVHRGANPDTAVIGVKDKDFKTLSVEEQIEKSLADFQVLQGRAEEIQALRSEEGREIAPSTLARLLDLSERMRHFAESLIVVPGPDMAQLRRRAQAARLRLEAESL